MIAFLAERYEAARNDLVQGYKILSRRGPDRGTVDWNGEELPFVVITREEQLIGLELRDYRVLDHAEQVSGRLIARAASRVRPPRQVKN